MALTGQAAPQTEAGVTFLDSDHNPAIDMLGRATLAARLSGPGITDANDVGIWSETEPGGPLQLVVRDGQAVPGAAAGTQFRFLSYQYDRQYTTASGGTTFDYYIAGPGLNESQGYSVWSYFDGLLTNIARTGVSIPGYPGLVHNNYIELASVNERDQVLFYSQLAGPNSNPPTDSAIWLWNNGAYSRVARHGDPAPGESAGVGMRVSTAPRLNRYGDVAFSTQLLGSSLPNNHESVIYVVRNGVFRRAFREGQRPPDLPATTVVRDLGEGTPWTEPVLNNLGQVVFDARVIGGTPNNTRAIFAETDGRLRLIHFGEDPAPGLPEGTRMGLGFYPKINDIGQTAFVAQVYPMADNRNSGLWIESHGRLRMAIREGDPLPDGGGWVFGEFYDSFNDTFTFNNHGQLAFNVTVHNPAQQRVGQGLFATDRAGAVRKIVAIGDSLEVAPGIFKTVSDVRFDTGSRQSGSNLDGLNRLRGFNDLGQVAFRAHFTDNSVGFFVSDAAAAEWLVPPGDSWRFLDDGSDQGVAWRASDFDDQSWSVGRAKLGYGDGDETTMISPGPDPPAHATTAYFRKSFEVADPSSISELTLSLLRDDGAAVYLNGLEVVRDNLSPDATFDQFASRAIANDAERVFRPYRIDPARLVSGRNVLAVEVHQSDATSSDLAFDLQLFTGPPPALDFGALAGGGTGFESPAVGALLYRRQADPTTIELEFRGDGGGVADFAGDHAYLLNNGALRLTTELVDLRQFLDATVSVDVRTWEDSATTDFEADDRLAIYLEATEDGLTFERLTLVAELRGGSQAGDPADQLKRLDLGGALGPFTNFRYDVPERFAAVRLVVEARNNSASERYVFDNVSISGTVIPEPASAALAFVGALVAVGYGCSRRGGPQRAKSA